MDTADAPDPQWGLALQVRRALELHGTYVTEIDTGNSQALVDLRWAAHQAGRLLGVRAKVDLGSHPGGTDSVTATVRCAGGSDTDRSRVEQGLHRLARSVRGEQTTTCVPTTVPEPRHPQQRPTRKGRPSR